MFFARSLFLSTRFLLLYSLSPNKKIQNNFLLSGTKSEVHQRIGVFVQQMIVVAREKYGAERKAGTYRLDRQTAMEMIGHADTLEAGPWWHCLCIVCALFVHSLALQLLQSLTDVVGFQRKRTQTFRGAIAAVGAKVIPIQTGHRRTQWW